MGLVLGQRVRLLENPYPGGFHGLEHDKSGSTTTQSPQMTYQITNPTSSAPVHAKLLAIVAVAQTNRVLCQQPGCQHSVYAAIHVVDEGGQLLALGSSCFAKRYGSAKALGQPLHAGASGSGRRLTDEERQLLIDNTAELIERFKVQAAQARAEAVAKLRALRAHAAGQHRGQPKMGFLERMEKLSQTREQPSKPQERPLAAPNRPWPWQHTRNFSVAVLRSPEGQHWVRVQAQDGSQKLAPWPVFEGWEKALPPECGMPDLELQAYSTSNIVLAITTLRSKGFSEPIVGTWPHVRPR
ncbi:hypothetical protein [Curvibacter lanceolatus]|jgi:hypothetical protein|uniref:hypothetical protein n=1 Tax=Curvibacter lanceolatus TaxID=86182 RepID=UPI0012FC63DD|nr:hypothetical protein [Curvibacter lanceolatus]